MLTTLVSIFLTIFGALRAAPLYYSRILTLGNTFFAATSIDHLRLSGITTGTPVLRLPPSPVHHTLPAGAPTPSDFLGPSLALLAAILTITLVLSGVICHLRALALARGNDLTSMHAGDPEKILHTVIDLSGVTYNGSMLTSDVELPGFYAGSTVNSMPLAAPSLPIDEHASSTPIVKSETTAASSCTASREDLEDVALPSAKAPSPLSVLPPSTSINPVTVPVEFTPAVKEDGDDAWDTWTNRRRRRPPIQAPPAARAWRARSLSVLSTSRISDSLKFSSRSDASIAPTPASSSRRSSIAGVSPAKRHSASTSIPVPTRTPRSVVSHNRFSALEVFEVQE